METKPSYKTSEFWLHNLFQVLLALNTFGVWDYLPTKWGKLLSAIAGAILGSAYFRSRGDAKAGIPYNPTPQVDPAEIITDDPSGDVVVTS